MGRKKGKRISQVNKNASEANKNSNRHSTLLFAILIIIFSSYFLLRDNTILENELLTLDVRLAEAPRYHEIVIKGTRYRSIIFKTIQHRKEFRITGKTYDATNHELLKSRIIEGSEVKLKVLKSEANFIYKDTYFNNYNEVYGLSKDSTPYIDLAKRKLLKDEDDKASWFFMVWGLVLLPYGLIKTRPLIDMNHAIIIVVVLEVIFFIFWIWG